MTTETTIARRSSGTSRTRGRWRIGAFASRIALVAFLAVVGVFFALPLAWLIVTPFDANPSFAVRWPEWTLGNFASLAESPYALRSLGNSLLQAAGTTALVIVLGTLASYALSRVNIPAAGHCCTGCCCSPPSSPAPPRWSRRSS